MYGLPDADRHALEAVCGSEKLMYCVPFNIEGDRFVRGYLAITDKRIYKLLDGEVLLTVNIEGSDDFRVEVMYGRLLCPHRRSVAPCLPVHLGQKPCKILGDSPRLRDTCRDAQYHPGHKRPSGAFLSEMRQTLRQQYHDMPVLHGQARGLPQNVRHDKGTAADDVLPLHRRGVQRRVLVRCPVDRGSGGQQLP